MVFYWNFLEIFVFYALETFRNKWKCSLLFKIDSLDWVNNEYWPSIQIVTLKLNTPSMTRKSN